MRFILTILLFFISFIAVAQVDSAGLKNAIQKLDKALLEKDSLVLAAVLHKDVSYGHSNGWVQTKGWSQKLNILISMFYRPLYQ